MKYLNDILFYDKYQPTIILYLIIDKNIDVVYHLIFLSIHKQIR